MMMVDGDHGMMKVDFVKPKRKHFGRNNSQKEREIVMHEVLDLSKMCLDALPLSSNINLGIIYKLDISNNNLQVPFFILCNFTITCSIFLVFFFEFIRYFLLVCESTHIM